MNITYEQKGSNYFVVKMDGKMVMQIMEGGMFGDGNVVIIENNGQTTPVDTVEEAKQTVATILSKIIENGE